MIFLHCIQGFSLYWIALKSAIIFCKIFKSYYLLLIFVFTNCSQFLEWKSNC